VTNIFSLYFCFTQDLQEQNELLERRLSATMEEISNLNHDVTTLCSVVCRARKFGTWNVCFLFIYNFVYSLFAAIIALIRVTHLSGKPGNLEKSGNLTAVREGNVRDFTKNQGKVVKKSCQGKVA